MKCDLISLELTTGKGMNNSAEAKSYLILGEEVTIERDITYNFFPIKKKND